MRIGNLSGRLVLASGHGVVDVARASGGRFSADPAAAYDRWDELVRWAGDAAPEATPGEGRGPGRGGRGEGRHEGEGRREGEGESGGGDVEHDRLGAPSPRPRQVFALALNYRDHAGETGLAPPEQPSVFTKFPSAVTGPRGDIALPGGNVDWEVELVAVIGRPARHVPEAEAWSYVAGLTVGQDISERRAQFATSTPQFALAKSFPGFAPMGPWLVTPDELDDPDDLELGCLVNGETMQRSRTSRLVFPVPALVAHLSSILPLLPGDVIYTGTPAGVGGLRHPPRFLAPGDELVSYVGGVGEMRHRFVGGSEERT